MMNPLTSRVLNSLTKWRKAFAWWQLGNQPVGNCEFDAVVHHRELSILLRAEMNTMTQLLVKKGVFTLEEWEAQLMTEAELLSKGYQELFPGLKADETGLVVEVRDGAATINALFSRSFVRPSARQDR